MATNVSEKDKTLNEIIDWCENQRRKILADIEPAPGEDAEESIRQAPVISSLPLDILKIHQMQIIKGTKLAKDYIANPFHVYSVDEYIELIIHYIENLRKDLVLERFVSQSPADLLIAPKWGLKNYQFTNKLINRMKEKGAFQGKALKD